MSTTNAISITIPADVINDCISSAKGIANALKPYLQALTEEQRHDLFKLGDKSVGYLQKLQSYVATHPQFAPVYMEIDEFIKDAAVVTDLQPLFQILASLFSDINDTRMLAGSEAMSGGQLYYAGVRTAAKANIPSAKVIYEDLSVRFVGRKGGSAGTNTPSTDAEKKSDQ